jgi:hypothetical protein
MDPEHNIPVPASPPIKNNYWVSIYDSPAERPPIKFKIYPTPPTPVEIKHSVVKACTAPNYPLYLQNILVDACEHIALGTVWVQTSDFHAFESKWILSILWGSRWPKISSNRLCGSMLQSLGSITSACLIYIQKYPGLMELTGREGGQLTKWVTCPVMTLSAQIPERQLETCLSHIKVNSSILKWTRLLMLDSVTSNLEP